MGDIVEAIYDFAPQSEGDIELRRGSHIEVLERLSNNWWKGRNLDTNKVGIFPSNYVKPVSGDSKFERPAAPPPPSYQGNGSMSEKQSYQPPPSSWTQQPPQQYQPPPPQQYGQNQYNQYPPSQQYAQYGPPPQQMQAQAMQQPMPQQQQAHHSGHPRMKAFASQMAQSFAGSVAWGAGSTVGSDMIHKLGF